MVAFEQADESNALQQFYIGQCAKYVCNINHVMQACTDIRAMYRIYYIYYYILFARAILLIILI